MKVLIKVLSVLGFLTTAGFAASGQEQHSLYFNIGQNFGPISVTDTFTKNSNSQETNLGKMRYKGSLSLGYEYLINDRFSVGAEFDVPIIKSLRASNISNGAENNYKISDRTGAGFLTVGYKVLEVGDFTTSVRAGIGAGVHSISMEKTSKDLNNATASLVSEKVKSKSLMLLTYKIGINQAVKISDNVALDLGISYVSLGSPTLKKDFGNGSEEKLLLKSRGYANASLGLIFSF